VISPSKKIPRRLASPLRDLPFDLAQRTLQLCRDALQQRRARVRRRAALAALADAICFVLDSVESVISNDKELRMKFRL
jgi:hypothetical protein